MRLFFLPFFACLLFSLSLVTSAAESFTLTLDMLDKFKAAQPAIEAATKKYPDFDEDDIKLDMLLENNGQGVVESLRTTGAYGELNGITKKHGFESIGQYVELMSRLMRARTALEFKNQNPADMAQIENMDVAGMRSQMLAQGLPEAMVDSQLAQMEEMKQMFITTKKAAESASEADLAFVAKYQAEIDAAFE